MVDRSANMRAIRSKDTQPEMAVRSLIHRLGYRFRLHRKDLPGKPDIVFPSRRKVIFVHGCFWHLHDCKGAHIPNSNRDYWEPKLRRNKARDRMNLKALAQQGWDAFEIWECELKDSRAVGVRVKRFLGRK